MVFLPIICSPFFEIKSYGTLNSTAFSTFDGSLFLPTLPQRSESDCRLSTIQSSTLTRLDYISKKPQLPLSLFHQVGNRQPLRNFQKYQTPGLEKSHVSSNCERGLVNRKPPSFNQSTPDSFDTKEERTTSPLVCQEIVVGQRELEDKSSFRIFCELQTDRTAFTRENVSAIYSVFSRNFNFS